MDASETSGTRGEQMMSPMEVAEYLGIGRTMVYSALSGPDRIKSYKIGKRRVIRRRDVDEWLSRREYDPADEFAERHA